MHCTCSRSCLLKYTNPLTRLTLSKEIHIHGKRTIFNENNEGGKASTMHQVHRRSSLTQTPLTNPYPTKALSSDALNKTTKQRCDKSDNVLYVSSTTKTNPQTCTSARASKRSRSSGRVPIAAPQRSCLLLSFVARGKSRFLIRSVRDINATSYQSQPRKTGKNKNKKRRRRRQERVEGGDIRGLLSVVGQRCKLVPCKTPTLPYK